MTEAVYFSPKLGKVLFWAFLFITIIGNFVISAVLVPIMLVMSKLALYGSIAFIGFCFGFLLNSILSSIEQLDRRHHIIAGILIPVLALINVIIFTKLSNDLIGLMHLSTPPHDPLVLAIVYVIAFTIPYLVSQFIKFKRRY